jgi:hypothetical protein
MNAPYRRIRVHLRGQRAHVPYARARPWDAAGRKGNEAHRLLNASPQIQRVVTDGGTPEQAVDEAIARIKQILSK